MDLNINELYPLYAITDDKKLRNRFKEERKEEMFIEKKSKMTKEEYTKFVNKNAGSVLSLYEYKHGVKGKCVNIEVLSTWFEREVVDDQSELIVTQWLEACKGRIHAIPYIFKDEYQQALRDLMYIQFFRLAGGFDKIREYLTDEEMEECDTYDMDRFELDEFNLFIELYGDTFNI